MKKEEYYMIREYNQYSLCKHLNNGMSISVTTIYAKNSGEAESMARINGIKSLQLIIGMAKKLGKSPTNTKERNEYQFYFQKKAQVSCDIL